MFSRRTFAEAVCIGLQKELELPGVMESPPKRGLSHD